MYNLRGGPKCIFLEFPGMISAFPGWSYMYFPRIFFFLLVLGGPERIFRVSAYSCIFRVAPGSVHMYLGARL